MFFKLFISYFSLLIQKVQNYSLQDSGEKIPNFAYFPILVEADYPISRDDLYQKLKNNGIHPRRYFYPLISDFPMYRGLPSAKRNNLQVAADAALKVLCLPIYPALDLALIETITQLISTH